MYRKLTLTAAVAAFALWPVFLLSLSTTTAAPPRVADRTEPSTTQRAVTASDSTNFTDGPCRSLYVGTGGDVAVVGLDDEVATWKNCPTGFVIPAACKRVNSTNTTASNILALYGVLCIETLRRRLRQLKGFFG